MIWVIIAIIGAGTFIFSGFSVLSDPLCQSVDFGGGRVIQITCRDDSLGAFSQTSAGWISILGGVSLLLFIFRKPIIKTFKVQTEMNGQGFSYGNTESVVGERAQQVNLASQEMNLLANSQQFSQDTKKCKYCAESINIEAIKCKHCGSSLEPNSSERVMAYLTTGQGKIVAVVSACLLLVVSGIYINESNKAKENRLLNTSGQICVTGDGDASVDFGCTNYPNGEIYFCSSAKVLAPYWTVRDYEDVPIEGANYNGRIAGVPGGELGKTCTDPNLPNLFVYRWKSDFRVGAYEMNSLEYRTIEGDTWIEDGSGSGGFNVEISIKE
jgi:hypothetical protein